MAVYEYTPAMVVPSAVIGMEKSRWETFFVNSPWME